MATKKFTLLELHFGDGTVQIGPATLGDGADDDADDDDVDAGARDDDGGTCPGRTLAKLLLVVGALALLAVLAARLLGGDEDLEELEDLAELE